MRKLLGNNQDEATEQLIDVIAKTATNDEFLDKLAGWIKLMNKGYTRVGKR